MCGIAGFTHHRGNREPGKIERATATLTHRGPDQTGVWEDPHVSLGAVRLKIIDLEHGNQPISSGGAIIVFNGEIYNHAALRAELESLGHRFDSRCDTEVVLRAFLEWDTASFKRLRGMFGVALWQPDQRRLVLARDRVGIKPLYFYERQGDLYFGSELKAILDHPEIPRRLDREALSYYLSLNYVPTPYTLIEGITKLRPGHFLEWRPGHDLRQECFWVHGLWPSQRPTLESASEELDRLLKESIAEHLISDVPLGVWASGGLDSTTVLHYASQLAGRKLKTFSVSFQGHSFDESQYFRTVAQTYGTDHHEFDLNPTQDLVSAIEQMAFYSDEPSADAGALPVWFLSKMCREHVTVALSGEGADELFAGYNTYLADRYAAQARPVPAWIRRTGLAAAQLLPVSDSKISFEFKVKRFLSGSLLDPQRAHLYWNGTFPDEERDRLYPSGRGRSTRDLYRWLPSDYAQSGELNRYLWLDQRFYLADDILYKCDRMSMAHSLEVRPPFLDHRLIEFANSLPEDLKIHDGQLKFLLRHLMRGKIPAPVLTRPKEGFDIPTHGWFRTILKPLLLETLNEQNVRATGLFDWPTMERLIASHLGRRLNAGYHLWGLLTLFLWMKRWNIETAPAPPAQQAAALSTR